MSDTHCDDNPGPGDDHCLHENQDDCVLATCCWCGQLFYSGHQEGAEHGPFFKPVVPVEG